MHLTPPKVARIGGPRPSGLYTPRNQHNPRRAPTARQKPHLRPGQSTPLP
jgi:hypothetical protein